MVERAKETNRWRILPDGTEVAEEQDFTPRPRTYKTPVPTTHSPEDRKQVASASTENKAVKKTKKK